MSEAPAALAAVLFTDLVGSTQLMQRVGDERAQGVFEAHHRMLSDALLASGGEELQWLGDGIMAAFASPADALRCAIAMQQGAAQPIDAESLTIRVGVSVGEILRQPSGSGYFGTPVVVARRLCDLAQAGEILCTSALAELLAGRSAFRFARRGPCELRGIREPVGVCEALYDAGRTDALLARTPFVGRDDAMARLGAALAAAAGGAGSLVLVAGEPGIGKTRLLEELRAAATRGGALVLAGRSYEGDASPPFAPFAQALQTLAAGVETAELRAALGSGASALARIVPGLAERLPDLPPPGSLSPDEERHRLLHAVGLCFETLGRKRVVLLELDDLHWADAGTLAMLRQVARAVRRSRMLVVGAYRDAELGRQHPLADALAALRREAEYERISLSGLDPRGVGRMLAALASGMPDELTAQIAEHTGGNPYFVREVLLHLLETGKLARSGGRWIASFQDGELGIPESVRQVIGRRVSRLGPDAGRLLEVAAGFPADFRFEVAARVAALDETRALDALDEALTAQLVRPLGSADAYAFAHALIRQTLYAEQNPSRQVRLHRRIADELARGGGDPAAIAWHFHRSAALPDAERGVAYCLAAADRAARAGAHDETVSYLRMALELAPGGDARRARVLARLGLALAWIRDLEQAIAVALDAAAALAAAEGAPAAAEYLADAAEAVWGVEFDPIAEPLAAQGLRYAGARRDVLWARLAEIAYRPGMRGDFASAREVARVLLRERTPRRETALLPLWGLHYAFESRAEVLRHGRDALVALAMLAGEYRESLGEFLALAEQQLERGLYSWVALNKNFAARMHAALGDLDAATRLHVEARALAPAPSNRSFIGAQLLLTPTEITLARGEGFEPFLAPSERLVQNGSSEDRWNVEVARMILALFHAHVGNEADALRWLESVLPSVEKSPGWSPSYTMLVHYAAETLWILERCDHVPLLERNLREKTLAPDFRYPHCDARLSLARLCVLERRHDEAAEWFAAARSVLDEQGARPLRAVVDLDEARACALRNAEGDRGRAGTLLADALGCFARLGMPGWTRRARALGERLELDRAEPRA